MDANEDSENDTITRYVAEAYKLSQEDSSWIVSNAFIILTMQTGDYELFNTLVTQQLLHPMQLTSRRFRNAGVWMRIA